jgi:hypothetical protein
VLEDGKVEGSSRSDIKSQFADDVAFPESEGRLEPKAKIVLRKVTEAVKTKEIGMYINNSKRTTNHNKIVLGEKQVKEDKM